VGKYIIVWVKWPERGTDEFNTMSMLRLQTALPTPLHIFTAWCVDTQ